MALADYVYRLKPEAADSTPHDELGLSDDLSGGTITLVDVGGGDYCWQFVDQAIAASVASRAMDTAVDGSGGTIAVRFAVTTYGASFVDHVLWAAAAVARGLGFGQSSANNIRGRYIWSGSSTSTATFAAGTSIHTLVVRVDMRNAGSSDLLSGWVGGVGSGDTADIVASASNYGGNTSDRLIVGNSGVTIRIFDLVLWGEELSDADCADLADTGIRAVLDAGGDTTAPILSSPTGTQTGSTTATIGATTDEANGTLYGFVSTSATPPSDADLKAGTGAVWSGSASVSGTGANTLNATGLTASTGYYGHLLHTDAAANDSNTVTSAQFTTAAAGGTALPVFIQQMGL